MKPKRAKKNRGEGDFLKDQFEMLQTVREITLDTLDKAISDHQFLADGGTLILAVDFHLIHEFAWIPRDQFKRMLGPDRGRSEKRNEFLIRRTALAHLLTQLDHSGPALLLPPYAVELRGAVTHEQMRSLEREAEVHSLSQTSLLNQEELAIAKELSPYSAGDEKPMPLPDHLKGRLRKMVYKKMLQDILYIAAGFSKDGIATIHELLAGKQPRIALRPSLPEALLDVAKRTIADALLAPRSPWFDALETVREGDPANGADAKAIDIVLSLNREFNRRDAKVAVCLISDTAAVAQVLNPELYASEQWADKLTRTLQDQNPTAEDQLSIYRPLEVVNLYLHAVNKLKLMRVLPTTANGDSIRPAGREGAARIAGVLRDMRSERMSAASDWESIEAASQACQKRCGSCDSDLKKRCSRLKEQIDGLRTGLLDLRSWNAVGNRGPYIEQFDEEGLATIQAQKAVLALIRFLNRNTEELESMIADATEKSEEALMKVNGDFRENIVDITDAKIFMPMTARLRNIPFKLTFHNEAINNLMEQMPERIQSHDDVLKMREVTKQLIRFSADQSLGLDRQLLIAIMLYYCNRLDLASKACEEHEETRDVRFSLLYCTALHQLAVQQKATENLEQAMEKCISENQRLHGDPRFLYLLGAMVLRAITRKMDGSRKPDEGIAYYQQALDLIAAGRPAEKLLVASIHNGIAFGITLKQDPSLDELDRAMLNLETMRDLVPEEQWPANFLDTKGVVFLMRSQKESDADKADGFARTAVETLNAASRRAEGEALPWEKDAIEEHRQLASMNPRLRPPVRS